MKAVLHFASAALLAGLLFLCAAGAVTAADKPPPCGNACAPCSKENNDPTLCQDCCDKGCSGDALTACYSWCDSNC